MSNYEQALQKIFNEMTVEQLNELEDEFVMLFDYLRSDESE